MILAAGSILGLAFSYFGIFGAYAMTAGIFTAGTIATGYFLRQALFAWASATNDRERLAAEVSILLILSFYGIGTALTVESVASTPPSVEAVPDAYMNTANNIDMQNAPASSSTNAQGFPRNANWYFRQLYDTHPEMFSDDNIARIFTYRTNPIVDDTWIEYNPTQMSFKGDPLIHHHVDGGPIATAIPERVHLWWFRQLHQYLNE